MEMNFCHRCGQTLSERNDGSYECANDHVIYINSAPAMSVFFVSDDNNKVLLTTRAYDPFKGQLDAPGGFLDRGESFRDAVKRELEEELGINPSSYSSLEYLAEGFVEYPFKGEVKPVVGLAYWARLNPGVVLRPMDDVSDANWYDIHEVDMSRISAQDIQNGIIALQKLFPRGDYNE